MLVFFRGQMKNKKTLLIWPKDMTKKKISAKLEASKTSWTGRWGIGIALPSCRVLSCQGSHCLHHGGSSWVVLGLSLYTA